MAAGLVLECALPGRRATIWVLPHDIIHGIQHYHVLVLLGFEEVLFDHRHTQAKSLQNAVLRRIVGGKALVSLQGERHRFRLRGGEQGGESAQNASSSEPESPTGLLPCCRSSTSSLFQQRSES